MDDTTMENSEMIDMEFVANSAFDEVEQGEVVNGEIVTIDSDFAYVNVGTKSDGRVPLQEFEESPKVGETVDVLIKNRKLVDGCYACSKKAAESISKWNNFLAWYKEGNDEVVGTVKSSVNKGKLINCKAPNAFLPFSLSGDLKSEFTENKEYSFKIKSIDEERRSVILSRSEFLEKENKQKWVEFLEKYKIGDLIEGKVIKFVEFGVFVKVAGIDALLHRNDMSWKKVFKQRKILKQDEVRDFIILDIKPNDGKISLGLKQMVEDPWLNIDNRINVGDNVKGKVTTVTNYGAFVEIEEGVEGFVSSSDFQWSKNVVNVKNFIEKGTEIDLRVLVLDKEDKKLNLGIKQLTENPWDTVDERFPIGATFKRTVRKIVKFGMFVGLEDGIDGLVHISDLSWDKNENAISKYKAGDEVEFKVLEIDKNEMKIACGVKQLSRSPWEIIKEKFPIRMQTSGSVSGITSFGLFVKLEDEVEGLVHISEVSKDRIENLEEHYNVGDKVDVVVLGVDVEKRRLSLSIKHLEVMSEKEELSRIMQTNNPSRPTLGDMIKIELEDK